MDTISIFMLDGFIQENTQKKISHFGCVALGNGLVVEWVKNIFSS
jgi:hypothetical protein